MRILRHSALTGLLPTAGEHRSAATALGERHPLTQALARQRRLARQTAVALLTVPAGFVGTVAHVSLAPVVLGASGLVSLAFVAAWMSTRRTTTDCVHELIVDGGAALVLPVVLRERRRLGSRESRENLARSLEQAVAEAWNWDRTGPRSRALPGIACLREATPEARAVIAALRSEGAGTEGVAMTARLLTDGQGSALYSGDSRRLREELGRIRFSLQSKDEPAEAARGWRAAA